MSSGFVGLGKMGLPIATRLVDAGHRVVARKSPRATGSPATSTRRRSERAHRSAPAPSSPRAVSPHSTRPRAVLPRTFDYGFATGLMNNAGAVFTPFGRTTDGFETQFGTNHLGHFELPRLLAPRLDGARVVILSSDGHRLGDADLDDPNWERREYDEFTAYGSAKTADILHAVELDRRLRDRGSRADAVHPGMVATNLARHVTRDDVAAITDLADRGGVYLADSAVDSDVAPYADDPARAARLRELSEELCDGG